MDWILWEPFFCAAWLSTAVAHNQFLQVNKSYQFVRLGFWFVIMNILLLFFSQVFNRNKLVRRVFVYFVWIFELIFQYQYNWLPEKDRTGMTRDVTSFTHSTDTTDQVNGRTNQVTNEGAEMTCHGVSDCSIQVKLLCFRQLKAGSRVRRIIW